jgi:uncharacterized protein YjiS (DUF1127 family)
MQLIWRRETKPFDICVLPLTPDSGVDVGVLRLNRGAGTRRGEGNANGSVFPTLPGSLCIPRANLMIVGRIAAGARRCWIFGKALIVEWRGRSRSRRELIALSDHELWDVGMTRGTAGLEGSKPFWRP